MAEKITHTATHIKGLDKLEKHLDMGATVASLIGTKGKANAGASATAVAAEGESTAAKAAMSGALLEDAGKATVSTVGVKLTSGLGGAWGTIRNIAGAVATPLMLLVGAVQAKKAVDKKDGHAAAQVTGGTVGSIGGMAVGDAIATGVISGMFGGPVGMLLGLGVGIGGAVFGGWLGSGVADKMIGDKWHQSLNRNARRLTTPTHALPYIAKPQRIAPPMPVQEVANETTTNFRQRILDERARHGQLEH